MDGVAIGRIQHLENHLASPKRFALKLGVYLHQPRLPRYGALNTQGPLDPRGEKGNIALQKPPLLRVVQERENSVADERGAGFVTRYQQRNAGINQLRFR